MDEMLKCQMHSPEQWGHKLNKTLVAFTNAR